MVSPRCFLRAQGHRQELHKEKVGWEWRGSMAVFHEMIPERDCRRWWAAPLLGRDLHKPQKFGKKVREERTWSDVSQVMGLAGLQATLLASKNTVTSWSVTRRGHSGAAHLSPKAAVTEEQVWLQLNVLKSTVTVKGTKPLTCRPLPPNPDRFCEWSRVIPICVFK